MVKPVHSCHPCQLAAVHCEVSMALSSLHGLSLASMDTCHGVPNHGGTKFFCQIVLMWRYAIPWYQITGDFIPRVPNFWGYQITVTPVSASAFPMVAESDNGPWRRVAEPGGELQNPEASCEVRNTVCGVQSFKTKRELIQKLATTELS